MVLSRYFGPLIDTCTEECGGKTGKMSWLVLNFNILSFWKTSVAKENPGYRIQYNTTLLPSVSTIAIRMDQMVSGEEYLS